MITNTNQQHAAFLRRCAGDLLREADRLDPPAVATTTATPPELQGTAARAARFIDKNGGALGKDVAGHLRITEEHFRSRVWPKLRRLGYQNIRGGFGYWAPGKFPQSM